MRDRAVVALEEVVEDGLPVGLDVEGQAVGEGERVEVGHMGAEVGLEPFTLLGEGCRARIEVDEDEAAELLDANRGQAELVPVEPGHLLGAPRGAQPAVDMVAPGVIGTGDDLGPPGALQQLVAPVLADVVEGAQGAVLAADRDDVLAGGLDGRVVARFAHRLAMADIEPVAGEDGVPLAGVDAGVVVIVRRQGIGALGVGVEAVDRPDARDVVPGHGSTLVKRMFPGHASNRQRQ